MATDNVNGRRKGDIAFSTARKLIEHGKFTYEQIVAAVDAGEGEKLQEAAFELAKELEKAERGPRKPGRAYAKETVHHLGQMGYTVEALESLSEEKRETVLFAARMRARADKALSEVK